MTAAEPTVSAVVATHQRRHALPRFMDAILSDDGLDELVVVVDGSTDGSAEYVRSRDDRRVRCIEVDHLGQFGALAVGIEAAAGEVVLLLDDDVIAEGPLAAQHRHHHAAAPGLVVIGAMPVADLDGSDWATKTIYAASYERRCRWFEAHPERVLEHLWGGNVSLRRDDARRVGLELPFELPPVSDARFYQQDRAFGLRCRGAGLRGVFDPALRALHQYERDLEAHRRDIRGRAYSACVLHHVYPTTMGPLRSDPIFSGGPPAMVLRAIAERGGYGVLVALFGALITVASRIGWRWLELSLVRSLNPIETARGLALAEAAFEGSEPLPVLE